MKTKYLALSILTLTSLGLAGCPSGDDGNQTGSSTGDESTNGTTVNPPTTMTTMDLDTTASTTEATSTVGTDTGETSTTGPDVEPYDFEDAAFEDYMQVDRMGFPAINTGLNLLGDKDAYNAASPVDDANQMFIMNIRESLETLHLGAPKMQTVDNTGLDDDLTGNGFTPCITPPLPMNNCDDQAGSFAIPDTLVIDLDDPAGFPNGRRPIDPVMDIIFAVLLLDLEAHSVTAFLDLDQDGTPGPSVNPIMNDVELPAEFPYLAPANE